MTDTVLLVTSCLVVSEVFLSEVAHSNFAVI